MNCKIVKLTKYPSNKIVKLDFFPKAYVYYCEIEDKKIFDFDEIYGYSIFDIFGISIKIINKEVLFQTLETENVNKDIKFKIMMFG